MISKEIIILQVKIHFRTFQGMKITTKFLEIISYLLEDNHRRKIILAGSNDNTDVKNF